MIDLTFWMTRWQNVFIEELTAVKPFKISDILSNLQGRIDKIELSVRVIYYIYIYNYIDIMYCDLYIGIYLTY